MVPIHTHIALGKESLYQGRIGPTFRKVAEHSLVLQVLRQQQQQQQWNSWNTVVQ